MKQEIISAVSGNPFAFFVLICCVILFAIFIVFIIASLRFKGPCGGSSTPPPPMSKNK